MLAEAEADTTASQDREALRAALHADQMCEVAPDAADTAVVLRPGPTGEETRARRRAHAALIARLSEKTVLHAVAADLERELGGGVRLVESEGGVQAPVGLRIVTDRDEHAARVAPRRGKRAERREAPVLSARTGL